VGVLLNHGASLCFVSLVAFQTCLATFQAKNNVRSAPASSTLTLVLHQSHNARTTNHHQHNSGQRNIWSSKENKDKLWENHVALELLQLVKMHITRQSDVEQ